MTEPTDALAPRVSPLSSKWSGDPVGAIDADRDCATFCGLGHARIDDFLRSVGGGARPSLRARNQAH